MISQSEAITNLKDSYVSWDLHALLLEAGCAHFFPTLTSVTSLWKL